MMIGRNRIEMCGNLTVTHLHDGKKIPALAQENDEYRARARELGYGDDIDAMSREHEILHSLLSRSLGLEESPTLRGVAEGEFFPDWAAEEAMILAAQKFCRAKGIDVVKLVSDRQIW